jgi:DNA repair protein RAD50
LINIFESQVDLHVYRPLSEPSILKKKFDDIFSSTKYTKALTNIKDLRKYRTENLRVDNQKLQSAASDKEKAAKIRKTLALMNNQMTKKREEVTEVDQKMHDVSSEIDSLLLKVQEFQSLDNRLNQKIHQMQVTGENRDELASNMTMMTQSDRELERMREQHQSRISADEEARQVIKAEQAELELQLKQYQQQVLAKVAELGKLEAEKTVSSLQDTGIGCHQLTSYIRQMNSV